MKNILVIAPHADDEILGCGATMAKHVANGDNVYVAILTNASVGAPELFSPESISEIRKEALQAHGLLGVKETFFMEFPAPALNAFPEYKISVEVSALIKRIDANVLYLPHPSDIHQDHAAVYRACLVAARPTKIFNHNIERILCYETLSETEWAPYQLTDYFRPNYFVDVDGFIEQKLKAMECFASQLRPFPSSRSIETLIALSKLRGSTVGTKHAEAFTVERILAS